MWDSLLNLLFPKRCVSCRRLGKYICSKCRETARLIKTPVCPICERPAIDGATHPGCQTRYSLDGLTSIFVYDGAVKKAIKELKYQLVTDLAKELISLLGGRAEVGTKMADFVPPRAPYVLTPVPLHWWRQRWRGFNQAEVLGKMIAEKLGIQFVPDLLVRKKSTRPQVELKGKARQENIKDAFSVNPRATQENIQDTRAVRVSRNQRQSRTAITIPSNVVLFDDVWTTGATLRVCGNVLKRAGAKLVWGLTLAR